METKNEALHYYTPLDLPPVGKEDCPNVPIPVMVWNDDRSALVKKGERDLQAEIDAAAVGLGVYDLLRRAQHGDTSSFDGQPIYGDFTDNPETLSEAKDVTDAADKVKEFINGQSNKVEQGSKPAAPGALTGAALADQMAKEKDKTSQGQEGPEKGENK